MGQPKNESLLERYVLCVDDDPEFLKSLEVFLPGRVNTGRPEGLWYRFVFVQDPAEALSVLNELVDEGSTVAMLISDQQMPSMRGTELLAEARRIAAGTLRVLLTGHAGIEAAITAINERLLDRYLTKPIEDEHDFTLSVQELLQRFEMQRVIEAQAAALQDLYAFANAINAMDRLDRMVEHVAEFARTVLESSKVCVVAGDGRGSRHCVTVDRTGAPRPALEADRLEELVRDMPQGAEPSTTGVREVPSAWRQVLHRHGLDEGQAAVCADLISGRSRVGFIAAGRQGPAFTESERRTLEYIAATASIAIHKQLTWSELQDAYHLTREQAVSLEEANHKLTTLDQMKTEFLHFISHELRTPLSYMSAIGILEGPVDPAEQAEITDIVRKGYNRLERFISKGLDYLDWCGASRIETTDVIDLRAVVRGVVESVTSAGSEIELEFAEPDLSCPIAMSGERAEEVVRILLENAVKFSDHKPRVRVELRSSGGIVTLQIADHGRGFPPEVAQDIFRPFTVMDTLHHREGTALNLARASAMIGAHGGRIRAESAGKGQGATFTIELPLAPKRPNEDHSAAIAARDEEDGDGLARRAA